jgi:ubiquinone/menaquinone biosynthesis C-methylase UbiE
MTVAAPAIPDQMLELLQCPLTGQPLHVAGDRLVSTDGSRAYGLSASGVPLFGDVWLSNEGAVQRAHYEKIAAVYTDNLESEPTREYMKYLDAALMALIDSATLTAVAEICCGTGEGLHLLGSRVRRGIGVDVSPTMLEMARRRMPGDDRLFAQGDATRLPLRDGRFDTVVMLGGIHHVNDRERLFGEVRRILKPGGSFIWREPVDDFAPWRLLRRAIYRWSSTLEADTEHPLRRDDTRAQLERAGFQLSIWRPLGFLGYCFLMNADVLAVNRLWRYVPGARRLARFASRVDDYSLQLPGLTAGGLLAVGLARRR